MLAPLRPWRAHKEPQYKESLLVHNCVVKQNFREKKGHYMIRLRRIWEEHSSPTFIHFKPCDAVNTAGEASLCPRPTGHPGGLCSLEDYGLAAKREIPSSGNRVLLVFIVVLCVPPKAALVVLASRIRTVPEFSAASFLQ